MKGRDSRHNLTFRPAMLMTLVHKNIFGFPWEEEEIQSFRRPKFVGNQMNLSIQFQINISFFVILNLANLVFTKKNGKFTSSQVGSGWVVNTLFVKG